MENVQKLMLIVASSCSFALLIIVTLACICKRKLSSKNEPWDQESIYEDEEMDMKGELIEFEGGEDLTSFDVLDALGEVIGKSSYGTLYRANLVRCDSVVVLRFLRPPCTGKIQDIMHVVKLLGSLRHPNLLPLCVFYVGSRGENLMVHPFYKRVNLAQFIKDVNSQSLKWSVIYRISIGIAKGLCHLHTSLQKPIIHGNLKLKNTILGRNQHPVVSDLGLHLLLTQPAAQEIVEDAVVEGYKPPELIKSNDISVETDIFNFGVILHVLLTGKEPNEKEKPSPYRDFSSSPISGNRILDPVNEEYILKLSQLAKACCSLLPSFRPDFKHICKKLQEIES